MKGYMRLNSLTSLQSYYVRFNTETNRDIKADS